MHGGEAAERRRTAAGLDRLGVLATGLAQVRVQVDEPGQQHEAVGVDLDRTGGRGGDPGAGDLGDAAVAQHEVGGVAAQDRARRMT